MSGTITGGVKARDKNLAKDPEFYRRIGALGGAAGRGPGCTKGFAGDRELARRAGRLGGMKSRRKPKREQEVIDE